MREYGVGESTILRELEDAAHKNIPYERVLSSMCTTPHPIAMKAHMDFIVSNPPYIARSEMERLDREVKDFEPALALDGGEDGLGFHRKIVSESPGYLRRGGWLLLEVGRGQAEPVSGVLEKNEEFSLIERFRDLSGIERVVRARKK